MTGEFHPVGTGRKAGLAEADRSTGIMATRITRDALEAFLNCKFKAHLKLAGQQGSVSDYETRLILTRQEVRQQVIGKLLARYPEGEVALGITLTAAALRKGPSFMLDTTLEDDQLSVGFDGLKRVAGGSKLGDFHYIPMLFEEGHRIRALRTFEWVQP
jgi:hypothetical protein